MHIMQSRRHFLASASLAAAAGVLGGRGSLADEGRLETTTVRLTTAAGICIAPQYLAGELLRADGFTDVSFVPAMKGPAGARMIGRGEADFTSTFAASIVLPIDEGEQITALAGIHRGCYELFASERIRSIVDLKGKRVGVPALRSSPHLYLSVMAKHIGLDPQRDIHWITSREVDPMEPFRRRGNRCVSGLSAGAAGAARSRDWPRDSQHRNGAAVVAILLLHVAREQRLRPQLSRGDEAGPATRGKRRPRRGGQSPASGSTGAPARAVLKSIDFCATEPVRAAERLVDGGFADRLDYAEQTLNEVPFGSWREFDPEDTIRFYALRLHEVGMIKSSPNKILVEGTDWRFLNDLKRELKA